MPRLPSPVFAAACLSVNLESTFETRPNIPPGGWIPGGDNYTSWMPDVCTFSRRRQGTYYPRGDGKIERGGLYQLAIDANSTDVVVAEHCLEVHQEHLLPENVDRCKRLNREYLAVDYADIMNTTFALVPAGRSPATYRLGEALSAGAIPVFVHDNFVKPFPARIPWHRCSFTFSSQDTPGIIDALRAVPHQRLLEMQVSDHLIEFCLQ